MHRFVQLMCGIYIVWILLYTTGAIRNSKKDANSRTLNRSHNSTHADVQLYLNLDENYVLIETNTSLTSAVSLNNLEQDYLNDTEEDDGSTLASRIAAVFHKTPVATRPAIGTPENEGRSFICSNVTLKVKEYHSPSNVHLKKLKLIFSNITRSGDTVTLCKPLTEEGFVVFDKKPALRYPTTLSIVLTSFIYTALSLLCALACIISVHKFIVIFIASNIFSYFLICILLTGSVTEILIYFIPIHLNFLLFLVTGWVTLLSCSVVFNYLIAQKVFSVVDGEVRGNAFNMIQLTMSLSCLFPLITHIGIGPYGVHHLGYLLENQYLKLMAYFTPSVVFLLLSVMGVDVVFTSLRKYTEDFGVRHTEYYLMFICYHLFAMVTWVYGIVTFNLYANPVFWRVYLFVTICLPLFFLKDVIMTIRARFLHLAAREAATEKFFPITFENV